MGVQACHSVCVVRQTAEIIGPCHQTLSFAATTFTPFNLSW